jgi:hypothetical protein
LEYVGGEEDVNHVQLIGRWMENVVGSQKIDCQDGGEKWWGFPYISQLRGEDTEISHGKSGTATATANYHTRANYRSLT